MLLQQGKKYKCIKKSEVYNFSLAVVYLAITSHQLLNNDACPVDVSEWDADLFYQHFTLIDADGKESVNHPQHYNQGGIECLDVIKAYYGDDGYEGFCAGNVLKYVMRYKHKENALEDLKKARFYLDEVIKLNENNE